MVKTLVILVSFCLLLPQIAAGGRPAKDTVVVAALDDPFPVDLEEQEKFLWQVGSRPEAGNFASTSTRNWKDKYRKFTDELCRKAADQKLDSDSLRKVLDLVFDHSKGELAYLPVAAYHTRMNDEPVWIVAVKWEYPLINKAPTHYYHIRIFAYSETGLTQMAFVTCG